jgi:hypothetical protein
MSRRSGSSRPDDVLRTTESLRVGLRWAILGAALAGLIIAAISLLTR